MDNLIQSFKENSKIYENFTTVKGYTLSKHFVNVQKEIENFEVYDDDIWVCSFSKNGTTWTQEMVWMITHDLDYKSAEVDNEVRMPYLEFSGFLPPGIDKQIEIEEEYLRDSIDFARKAKRPRILKTHLPFELLPKQIQTFERNPKIIYVYRNMKDTCVSFYHHCKLFAGYSDGFDQFWKEFLLNKVAFTPMIDSVQSYWQHKDKSNFYYVRYEDMKLDLRKQVLEMCKFLNKSYSKEQIDKLLKHLSFETMKCNPYVDKHVVINFANRFLNHNPEGHFFRKGESGSYKAEMTPEIEQVFDDYLKKNLVNTDLQL